MSELLDKIFRGELAQCYVVAEIGSNFNGDMDIAKRSIDSAVAAGADAVKFQTFKADEFVADKTLEYTYIEPGGKLVTETQFDMFKRLELRDEWHLELMRHAVDMGVDFFSSAAGIPAVNLLISLRVPAIKIASEDLINVNLLEHVAKQNYRVMLSTGMADATEIKNALDIFKNSDTRDILLMHCVSQYPTPLENAGLRRILALSDTYGYPVGYSDHTFGYEAPMMAVCLGAQVIEKHFTLDHNMAGPDHGFAANPHQFSEMVEKIRSAEMAAGLRNLCYQDVEEGARSKFRRSIVARSDLRKGTSIEEKHLAYKRPGHGLKPYEKKMLIGKKLMLDLEQDDMIQLDMLEN